MTIKNTDQNISAESESVITNIERNTLVKENDNYKTDLILTITDKDQINNIPHSVNIQIPLSELITSDYLNNNFFTKTQINELKELYYTISEIQNKYYTKTEVDNKVKVHFDVRNTLPEPENALTNYIYLIPSDDEENNLYEEYIYLEAGNNFELIGSTKIDLDPYLQKTDFNEYLIVSDAFTNLENIVDVNTLNINSLSDELNNLFNKIGFKKDGIEDFNIAMIKKTENNETHKEFWFLANAYYDYEHNIFLVNNPHKNPLGFLIKENNSNFSLTIYSYPLIKNNEIVDWTPLIEMDNGEIDVSNIVLKSAGREVLTEYDYENLADTLLNNLPNVDSVIADNNHLVYNSAVFAKVNEINTSIDNIINISNSTFKTKLWDFVWGTSGFVAEDNVVRGETNLGSFIYDYIDTKFTAISPNFSSSLSDHNTSPSAHQDIRSELSNKSDVGHSHSSSSLIYYLDPTPDFQSMFDYELDNIICIKKNGWVLIYIDNLRIIPKSNPNNIVIDLLPIPSAPFSYTSFQSEIGSTKIYFNKIKGTDKPLAYLEGDIIYLEDIPLDKEVTYTGSILYPVSD